MSSAGRTFTMAEVAQHKGPSSFWFVIQDVVYDVSNFLDDHPGGRDIIKWNSGTDATENFVKNGHSPNAKKMMTKYVIGELVEEEKKFKNVKTGLHVALPDTLPDGSPLPTIAMSDVASKTSTATGMWIVVNNRVIDVTKFGGEHPGGPEILAANAGTDATAAFVNKGHSVSAVKALCKLVIGVLPASEQKPLQALVKGTEVNTQAARQKSAVAAKKGNSSLNQFLVWQAMLVALFATVIYLLLA